MLKILVPEPGNSRSFFFNPKEADKVYFVFTDIPSSRKGEVVFLCSLITIKGRDDLLRFEPRYFDKSEMFQFVSALGLKETYDSLLSLVAEAENAQTVINTIEESSTFSVEERDVNKWLREGGSPFEYADYTTCGLFCYEPKTALSEDGFVKTAIESLRSSLEGGSENE